MLKKAFAAVLCLAAAVSASAQINAYAAAETGQTNEIVINAADFGAYGDDEIDDFEPLQKALKTAKTSAVPVRLIIPSGTYYLSSVLRIYSNTYVECEEGAEFIRTNEESYMFVNGADGESVSYNRSHDITVDGGIWDGNVTDTTKSKGLARIWNARNIHIKNAQFKNCCGGHFLMLTGVADATVTNTDFSGFVPFTGTVEQCIEQTGFDNVSYRNCETLHLDFVEADPENGEWGTPCQNIKVSGCTFTDCVSGIGTHHIYDYMSADCIRITNNSFENISYACVDAASFTNFLMSGNTAKDCGALVIAGDTDGVVKNNTITAKDSLSGYVYDMEDCYQLNVIKLYSASNIMISGNSCRSSSGHSLSAANGSTADIKNNRFTYAKGGGAVISSGSIVKLTGNTIAGCKSNAVLAMDGSQITQLNSNVIKNTGGNGVLLNGSELVSASGNTVTKCIRNGFCLMGASKAHLSENEISSCSGTAVYTSEKSQLYAYKNRINKNKKHAFFVSGRSKAQINLNKMISNGGYDLYLSDGSRGVLYKSNTSDKGKTKISSGCSAKIVGSVKILSKSDFKIPLTAVYTGSQIKPKISTKLEKNLDYTVSYGKNTATGIGTVKITGKGSFTGTVKYSFYIKPKKTAVKTLSSSSQKMRLEWKKTAGCSGYEIEYSTSSKFTSAKKLFVSSDSTAKTIKGLKSGKKYYVRIRAYKNYQGKKLYGAWSDVKSVKIK
ncbi:MAG: right-handed parallel beta-helix repeat-containing protein [Oscillospiraceae bacterium]